MDLLHRAIDVAMGEAGEADMTILIMATEIFEPVVVNAQYLVRGLGVVQLGRGAEDAVNHLGVDTVRLLVER
jgi:hypothetical protein